jgi:aldose 1-epimerase
VRDRANLFTADGLETVTIVSPDADLQATFVPAAGMVCGSLQHLGEELLAQRNGVRAYAERGSTMGIPLLHPWANRLAGFDYAVATRVVKLEEDSPLIARDARGLPIHGVIPGRLSWEPIDPGAAESANRLRARMRWDRPELLAIFPFPHALELDARMAGSTLTIETTLRPSADVAVPVSFGYHPYLTIPCTGRGGWQVELPVTRRLLLDERMIPTGASEPFGTPRFELGQSGWDDAFTGLARPHRFAASAAGRRIELEFLEGYPYAQVFAPAGESFICFEPMTAPTNALLSGADLPLVGPGEVFRAAFRVSVAGARE